MANRLVAITCVFLCGVTFLARAQKKTELELMDDQVWTPYIKAYNEFDTKHFMALHTDDVIRVKRESSEIMVGTEYRKNEYRRNSISLSKDIRRSLELRFIDRLVEDNIAYVTGYFKVTVFEPGTVSQVYYGKFHTVLKKIGAEWKIYIDEDELLPGFSDTLFYGDPSARSAKN